jgi:very-short-patch-repair endonuclease
VGGQTVQYSKETARILRRNQTPAEEMFWKMVRNRRFDGKRFLRQHPIEFIYSGKPRFFVADFYCPEQRLVIEIDGPIHGMQYEYDELRTFIINQLGIRVIRFLNNEIEENTLFLNKLRLNFI